MGTGYTRNDTGNNIADGNVINASDLDGEFDAVESAFNSSTGHTHDGTSAEGGPITKLGPVQDLVVSASAVTPKTDNTLDLGSTSLEFKDAFFDGTVNADGLTVVGAADITGDLDVDNINIDGNAITSTDTNGNIALTPNGTGDVQLDADTVRVGDSNADVTITTNGTGDLTLNTNSGTDSGSIVIADAANGNITLAPNGTGDVHLDADTVRVGDSNADATITTNGTGDLTLNTNSGTDSGSIVIADAANGNIAITPNGTGEVDISKVDIDSGAIDGVTIGTNSAVTELQVDNINVNGNTISSTDTDGNITLTPNGTGVVNLVDSDKLTFGAGPDLEILHNSTDSIIENKTGDFILRTQSAGALKIQDTGGNAIATFTDNGAIELTYNSSTKLATKSDGVDITGELQADSLDIDGDGTIDGSLTITTADNTAQLTLKSTDGDASSGPELDLIRESASPADDDEIGHISFKGQNDAGTPETVSYAEIDTFIRDFTDGTEDGELRLNVRRNGTLREALSLGSDVVFNEGSEDVDVRMESNGNTHMFFLDGGNNTVGIGTDSATNPLTVRGDGGTGTTAAIRWRDESDQGATLGVFNGGNVVLNSEQGDFNFYFAGTNKFTLESGGDLDIDDGNLKVASGHGIDFSATSNSAGTMSAELFDDYEEGTWTPTAATSSGSAGSFTVVNAFYTKIGRMVHVRAELNNINTSGTTSSAAFRVAGFPFTIDKCGAFGVAVADQLTLQGSRTQLSINFGTGEFATFVQSGGTGSETNTDHGDLNSGTSDIFFQGVYFSDQ